MSLDARAPCVRAHQPLDKRLIRFLYKNFNGLRHRGTKQSYNYGDISCLEAFVAYARDFLTDVNDSFTYLGAEQHIWAQINRHSG